MTIGVIQSTNLGFVGGVKNQKRIPWRTSYYQQFMSKFLKYTLSSQRTYELLLNAPTAFDSFRVALSSVRTDGTKETRTIKAFSPATTDKSTWNAYCAAGSGNFVNLTWLDPVSGNYDTTAEVPNGSSSTVPGYLYSALASCPTGGDSGLLVLRVYAAAQDITIQDTDSENTPFNQTRTDGRILDCTSVGGSALTTYPTDAANSDWCPIAGVEFFLRGKSVMFAKIGDSLINGGYNDPYGDGYVDPACVAVSGITGKWFESCNLSRPGASATTYGPIGKRIVEDFHPQIVLLETCGPNDLTSGMTLDAARKAINAARVYADETRRIAESYGALVIDLTFAPCSYINPNTGLTLRDYSLCDAARIEFNQALRASGRPVLDTDAILAGSVNPTSGQVDLKAEYDYDSIHWNQAGVNAVRDALTTLLLSYDVEK